MPDTTMMFPCLSYLTGTLSGSITLGGNPLFGPLSPDPDWEECLDLYLAVFRDELNEDELDVWFEHDEPDLLSDPGLLTSFLRYSILSNSFLNSSRFLSSKVSSSSLFLLVFSLTLAGGGPGGVQDSLSFTLVFLSLVLLSRDGSFLSEELFEDPLTAGTGSGRLFGGAPNLSKTDFLGALSLDLRGLVLA